MAEWIQIRPGRYIRRCSDGEYEGKAVGSIRRALEVNRERQRETNAKPSMLDPKEEGPLGRIVAAYPEDVEQEIVEKCGFDEDKRNAFLADHPEWLVTSRRNAGIPSRKKYFYPR